RGVMRVGIFALIVLLAILLIPENAWLFTLVQHGESPKFPSQISGVTLEISPASYCITIVHPTNIDQLAVAGLQTVKWQSDRRKKRYAEMLNLRSAFLDWFVEEWARQGGDREQAIKAIRDYPFQPNSTSGTATPAVQCGGK